MRRPHPPPLSKRKKTRRAQTDEHLHASPALRKNKTNPIPRNKPSPRKNTTNSRSQIPNTSTPPTLPALRKMIKYTPPSTKPLPAFRKQLTPEHKPNYKTPTSASPSMGGQARFTVGKEPDIPEGSATPVKGGKIVEIMEARRIMEEKGRKERRYQKVKILRPLVSTPNQKRPRDQPGAWEPCTPCAPAMTRRTPATPKRQLDTPGTPVQTTQKTIKGFLVKQTPAEKREAINNMRQDMSALPGVSKPTAKPNAAHRGFTGASKKLQKKPGSIASFLRCFENDENVPNASLPISCENASDNNNPVSQPRHSQNCGTSASPRQQMSGQSETAAKPITGQTICHVTGLKSSAPISICHPDQTGNQENVSHL